MEWAENPVTIALKKLAEAERVLTARSKGLQAFQPFKPEHTQEILASLNGEASAWRDVIDSLEGNGLWELDYDSYGTEDEEL